MTFDELLAKYRATSESERDKGTRFERLMKNFLLTYAPYRGKLKNVWLWQEFPHRADFGGIDLGIDIVAETNDGEYWAVQCKFYAETTTIHHKHVASFIATSAKTFNVDENFSARIWISTTNNYTDNARETLKGQTPEIEIIDIEQLRNSNVNWNELDNGKFGRAAVNLNTPREYQIEAIDNAHNHFQHHDRGKLIMACGTGKTFTSLKIAEDLTNSRGMILFLVPSISLIGQTLIEWNNNASKPINALCICSDIHAADDDEIADVNLPLKPMTDSEQISAALKNIFDDPNDDFGMTVIFSTYQSIEIVHAVQESLRFTFDLVICDEAHRTATAVDKAERRKKNSALGEHSAFSAVHDNNFICAKKRLYMTATPKMYSSSAQDRHNDKNLALWSMDNENVFGGEIYTISFKDAIDLNRLSDYKVLVLTIPERGLNKSLRAAVYNKDNPIKLDETLKLVGCINALSKKVDAKSKDLLSDDLSLMHTALAFCSRIKDSEYFRDIFADVQTKYKEDLTDAERNLLVNAEWSHVDGTMNAIQRGDIIHKLKTTPKDGNACTVVSNARCLSEGVDVPALDAVIFLAPKKSRIEIVQSVGRAMRIAAGKKFGYIIIPVVVPMNKDAETILGSSDFKEVWQIVNALRAHDKRIDTWIEQIRINRKLPKDERTPVEGEGKIIVGTTLDNDIIHEDDTWQTSFIFEELRDKIYARMVELVGNPHYWVDWAYKVKDIVERHTRRIHELIAVDGEPQRAFRQFINSLQTSVSTSITDNEAVDMLAQHLVTRPVFEALFDNYSFVNENPVSQSLQNILTELDKDGLDKDNENFERLYKQVRESCTNMGDAKQRQEIIIRLYDSFFKIALPTTAQKLGIVYTPVEVVDFILNSVNDVLQHEFHRKISDANVHILDPFTGTGTFIVRLIQSGLIPKADLPRKYQSDLHANELVLLAYYIAAINIENAFNAATDNFLPFSGICLTDTFEAHEQIQQSITQITLKENSERVLEQKHTPIKVIVGNPPYSVGQRSANDNAQNKRYDDVFNRISATYAKGINATLKRNIYDSYIKAFRWASDRIGDSGIVAFVTNAGWLDGEAMDGMRKCFEKEFTSIYVFNLRGNARTQGEIRRKERDNVFGQGTRTPIAITVLVKNPAANLSKAEIRYCDIGDYLSREDKLAKIQSVHSVLNEAFTIITPNERGDWINQRGSNFNDYIPLVPDKKFNIAAQSFFIANALGVATNRDAWCYNYSRSALVKNINTTIDYYNSHASDDVDSTKITWTRATKANKKRGREYKFNDAQIVESVYRPFCKQHLYYCDDLIEIVGTMSKILPTGNDANVLICVSDISVLISDKIVDLHFNGDTQCFPLYWYEQTSEQELFSGSGYKRRDGVTDFILKEARSLYGGNVTKEDIFYYVYGFLHLPGYRAAFGADLKKSLPRIFLVDDVQKFWRLSKAGRDLATVHLNYERQGCPAGVEVDDGGVYRVRKMKFADDKTTLIYNEHITIRNIPLRSYEYVVNGRSPLEWIVDRYQVKVDKASGIVNDPNDWGDERYILNLILSCITVSLRTLDIVDNLPEVEF